MDLAMLETLHEQYNDLKSMIKSEKIGTETEPGWNDSTARTTLCKMMETIASSLQNINQENKNYYRLLAMQGVLYYQHAKVLVQFKEMKKAEEVLHTCTEFLKAFLLVPEITFLGLRVLNHYCYLLTKNGELEKSMLFLELAEKNYLELKESNDIKTVPLYSNDDLFEVKFELNPNKEVNEKLERLVTNNLQMLGYVYNKKGNMDKFAVYHHQVLKRQLDMREGDATVWAMKTARLGYFFLTRSKFSQARHHLAAACYVLSQYENNLKTLETTDLVLSKWEELNHRYADIAKCWVKYGLFLFNASKMKLVSAFYGESASFLDNIWTNPLDLFIYGTGKNDESEEQSVWNGSDPKIPREELHNSIGSTDLNAFESTSAQVEVFGKKEGTSATTDVFDVIFENSNPSSVSLGHEMNQSVSAPASDGGREEKKPELESTTKSQEPDPDTELDFQFSNLDLSCFENCVSCNYVDSFQAARALFLFTHSWLKKSKQFYTLKDHPMEYVNVILDLSELYRYLAFYEDDIENQYSVQKRRADTLETLSAVLKEVRPQCYIAVSVELLRELTEVHLELMGLNLRRLYIAQPETSKEVAKSPSEFLNDLSEHTLRKMEAVSDIHQRLDQCSDSLGHGALGDFDAGVSTSDVENPVSSDLFDSYQTPEVDLF